MHVQHQHNSSSMTHEGMCVVGESPCTCATIRATQPHTSHYTPHTAHHHTPPQDSEIRRNFQRTLQKQGFTFKLNTKVVSAKVEGDKVVLVTEPAKGGAQDTMEADVVLVSAGVWVCGSVGGGGGEMSTRWWCLCV